jgi:hypothetical protein
MKVQFNQILFLVALLAVGGAVATGKLAPEVLVAFVTWFMKSPMSPLPAAPAAPETPGADVIPFPTKKDGE